MSINVTSSDEAHPAAASAEGAALGAGMPCVVARSGESRAYFRCAPLAATISVEQCRANRARLSPRAVLDMPYEVPSWWVQPLPCWSCSLAPRVEAGRVPFFTAEEVLAGHARAGAMAPLPSRAAPRAVSHPLLPASAHWR